MEPVDWLTLVGTARPDRVAPVTDERLGSSPTVDDIRRAAQSHVPQLPADVFDNQPFYDLLVKGFGPPSASEREAIQPALYDPWNCLVGHLGFWGAVAALTFVAICVACLSWIISSGLPLIWPIIWEALTIFGLPFGVFYVAIVIVSCLLGFTPSF